MDVAASTACFPDLPLQEAITKLVDLEFTRVELTIKETGGHLKPSLVAADLDRAIDICRGLQRLTPVVYDVDIEAEGEEYYRQFAAITKLAKSTKVVTLVVPGAELGTPFNAEVERLRQLVGIATVEGAVVAVKTEIGRVTQDPDTVVVLCDNVKGLGVTLDPSHFMYGENAGTSYDQLFKYTAHVHLRDTNKDSLQVRVGQGEIEYGRLINMLAQQQYNRVLSVNIEPMPDVDQMGEVRKLRLLLESLM